MTDAERQLEFDRATRNAARRVFDARLERVRTALNQKSLGARARDEAVDRAIGVAGQGLDIARESRWVLVGTALAIVAWLGRGPLLRGAIRTVARVRGGEPVPAWARLGTWMKRKVRR